MKERKQKERKLRCIKVLYAARRRKEGAFQETVYTQVPRISMEGGWLEKAGFHIGDRILLEYSKRNGRKWWTSRTRCRMWAGFWEPWRWKREGQKNGESERPSLFFYYGL